MVVINIKKLSGHGEVHRGRTGAILWN